MDGGAGSVCEIKRVAYTYIGVTIHAGTKDTILKSLSLSLSLSLSTYTSSPPVVSTSVLLFVLSPDVFFTTPNITIPGYTSPSAVAPPLFPLLCPQAFAAQVSEAPLRITVSRRASCGHCNGWPNGSCRLAPTNDVSPGGKLLLSPPPAPPPPPSGARAIWWLITKC